ncbi:MAG TPA: AI-2E family transporter, partial [Candidatus Paceibacterota bacterium]
MESKEVNLNISITSIVKVLVVLALAAVLFMVRDVFLIILTAIVIASAIEPGARFGSRFRIPRALSILVMYVVVGLLFLAALYFLLVPLLSESSNFLSSIPEYTKNLSSTSDFPGSSFIEGITSTVSIPDLVGQINTALLHISSGFLGTIDVIFGGILSFVLIIVLSFYFAVQEDGVSKFLRIITPAKEEKYVTSLWRRAQEKIGLWMQGQLLLAVIVAILAFLGLTILGVPNALLLAFIAGVLEIIPIFGPILSAVP